VTSPHRIDVHYHIIPEPYVAKLAERTIHGSTGVRFPKWSVDKALRDMDREKVATAITSLSTPGVQFGDRALGRELARICNDFQAKMAIDHPGRFRSFAFLPLPDVDAALLELERCIDDLGHDGVILLTDTDGKYLGHPDYEDLFAELDRRNVVVFIHPHTEPNRERRHGLFHPLLEWPVHTTRAAADLLYSGRLGRYTNIRYILAHGGGAVPVLASRIVDGRDVGRSDDALRSERRRLLQTLYFDVSSPGDPHLAALTTFARPRNIVFGTDGGWTPNIQINQSIRTLLNYDGFDSDALLAIERRNAEMLFPQLRVVGGPPIGGTL
jgi:predicted TIM-barrel fold metal-dependent hydrolase